MIKLLFLCLPFFKINSPDTCTGQFVDELYKHNSVSNFYLCLPVEVSSKKGRILIQQEDFAEYMIGIESSFANVDSLKIFVKEILTGERVFYFSEFVYKELVRNSGYKILFDKNKLLPITTREKENFLTEYLYNYTTNGNFFNFNTGTPQENFFYAVEALFKMNFILCFSDGSVNVVKVTCK